MIEFGFNEEQEMFRQETRSFIKKELAPLARDKKIREKIQKANEVMNLNTLNFPERLGGWDLDNVSTGILIEEFYMGGCFALSGLAFERVFTGNDLKKLPDEVQDEIGPDLISMKAKLRHAYTEGNSGNEQAAIRTRAERQGDYYILNGEKQPATGCGGATYNVVTAVTDPEAGVKGISQFLIPRFAPGVSITHQVFPGKREIMNRDGAPATPENDPTATGGCVVALENVKIPAKYRIGEEGEGLEFLHHQHTFVAISSLALRAVCAARYTLNEIIEFAGQRVIFGQPVIKNQGVSFEIAEHYTKLEAARMIIFRALYNMDQGIISNKDLGMAKWYALEVAERALIDLVRLGGYPYWANEMPLSQRLITVIGHTICDGQPQMQKLRILSEIAPDALPPGMIDRLVV